MLKNPLSSGYIVGNAFNLPINYQVFFILFYFFFFAENDKIFKTPLLGGHEVRNANNYQTLFCLKMVK